MIVPAIDNLYLLLSPEFDAEAPPVPTSSGAAMASAPEVVSVGTWTDWGPVEVVCQVLALPPLR